MLFIFQNQFTHKKKLKSEATSLPPKKLPTCYESISPHFYERTNLCYESTEGDDDSELYSSVKKCTAASKDSSKSFDENTDSAYNSGSSVNYYGSTIQSCSDTDKRNPSDYNYITPSERDYNYIYASDSTNKYNSGDYNYINPSASTNKCDTSDYKNSDSGVGNSIISSEASCTLKCYRPEPPDISKLPTSHQEQQRKINRRNLPPLKIK